MGYVGTVGCKEAFNFGEYQSVWTSCAIRPLPLAKIWAFLFAILAVDPTCAIKYCEIKKAVLSVFHKQPDCKPNSRQSMHDQAAEIAHWSMAIMAHLRRLAVGYDCKREQEKAKQALSVHPVLYEKLFKGIGIIAEGLKQGRRPQADEHAEEPERASSSSQSSCERAAAARVHRRPSFEMTTEFKSHVLVRHKSSESESMPTQDDDGFPSMSFMGPAATKTPCPRELEADLLAAQVPAMRVGEKKATKAKAAAKKALKKAEKAALKIINAPAKKHKLKVKKVSKKKIVKKKILKHAVDKKKILKEPSSSNHVTKECDGGWVLHTFTRTSGTNYHEYAPPNGGGRLRTLIAAKEMGFTG
jgi:hypothetical protein